MKNLLKKIGGGIALASLALVAMAQNTYAAVDASLSTAMASSTSFFSDNLSALMSFLIDIIFKFGGYALAIGVVTFIVYKLVHLVRRAR